MSKSFEKYNIYKKNTEKLYGKNLLKFCWKYRSKNNIVRSSKWFC